MILADLLYDGRRFTGAPRCFACGSSELTVIQYHNGVGFTCRKCSAFGVGVKFIPLNPEPVGPSTPADELADALGTSTRNTPTLPPGRPLAALPPAGAAGTSTEEPGPAPGPARANLQRPLRVIVEDLKRFAQDRPGFSIFSIWTSGRFVYLGKPGGIKRAFSRVEAEDLLDYWAAVGEACFPQAHLFNDWRANR